MLWLHENNNRQPNPEEILTLGAVEPGGEPLTPDEVEACAEYLAAIKLIRGHGVWGRPMPLRVRLTDDGLRCVLEFNGDVTAWLQSQRPSYLDQSVNVNAGRDAQVAAHVQNVNQAQNESAVKVDDLTEAVHAVRELIPHLGGVDGIDLGEVQRLTGEIEAEAEKSEPDHGKLRRLGGQLKDLLGPAAAALTIGKFAVGALAAAIA